MMRVGVFEKRRGQRIAARWRRPVDGRLAWAWLLGMAIGLSVAQARAAESSPSSMLADATLARYSESLKPISLAAGNALANIMPIAKDKPYAVGAPVFIEIALQARTPRARSVAEIVLTPKHAVLGTILAKDAVLKRNGDVLLVAFDGRPARGRRPRVLVEVISQKSAQAMSALTITLRKPDRNALLRRRGLPRRLPGLPEPRTMRSATPRPEPVSARAGNALAEDVPQRPQSAAATLEWPVADCAGAYYSALRVLYERDAELLKTALRTARRAIKSYPRRWAFQPNLRRRTGRCLRWRRRRCVRRAVVIADNGFLTREERKILIEAGRVLSRGGVDRSLNRRADTGWATGKALSDVTRYLRQPQSPALCAGADSFIGYYEKRLSGLSDRAKTLAGLAEQAQKLARQRAHEAHQALRTMPGGHPGWGGAGLGAAAQTEPVVAQDMPALAQIGAYFSGLTRLMGVAAPSHATDTPVSVEKVSGSATEPTPQKADIVTILAALNTARRAWIAHNRALVPALRAPLHAALVMNEAAFHLSVSEQRYRALATAVFGTLNSMRAAHNQSCICAAD